MNQPSVIITGVSGFVAGQTMLHLRDQGWRVTGIDQRPLPPHLQGVPDEFIQADFASDQVLGLLLTEPYQALIHCAATSLVGPSVLDPALYYHNNFVGTKRLLDFLVRTKRSQKLIVASSSSVYGEPDVIPTPEDVIPQPVSPYGESKRMVEQMLASYHRAYGLDFVALRYFNVCGADPQARHGQAPGGTHIMARVLESLRDDADFRLNGQDYATPDGTCTRDHVHVQDLARLHEILAQDLAPTGFYNVGLGEAHSNLYIIQRAQQLTQRQLKITVGPRREGDPSQLLGQGHRIRALGWTPQFNLDDMLMHAWAWYNRDQS